MTPGPAKPKVLFVSRERFALPLHSGQLRKWNAIGDVLDYRILAAATTGSPTRAERLELAAPIRPPFLDGALYYLRLPGRIARELRAFGPDAAWVQGVHEAVAFLIARAVTRGDAKLILDVQGDWRAATRLYGSRARRLLNPLNDVIGATAVRRADAVRTLSHYTTGLVHGLGVESAGEFPPFVDCDAFLEASPAPLPERPRALFVGVLERYKGFDTLAAAWPHVLAAVPDATLHIVGRGTLGALAVELCAEHGTWTEALDGVGVARALDEATLLCLPSRAEGLGRVVVEAMCRGRAVVGAAAGGIPDVVEDGQSAILVPPEDAAALAGALIRVLGDRPEAERLGAAGRRSAERHRVTPRQFATGVEGVVRRGAVSARPTRRP